MVACLVLVAANVIAAAGWMFRDPLVAAGLLAPSAPLPSQVVLPAQPLPPADAGGDEVAAPPEVGAGLEAELSTLGGDAGAQPATSEPEATPAPGAAPAESSPRATDDAPPPPDARPQPPDAQPQPRDVGAVAPADAASAAPECVHVGPFADRDAAVRLQALVDGEGGEASILVDVVPLAPRYLVHLPPAVSRAAARQARDSLAARGVDAFVIASGQRLGGVSVGVFSTPERANAQRDRVSALGHDVRIAKLERSAERYRLRAQGVAPSLFGATAWEPCPGPEVDRDAAQ